jgi:hypothetical protein
MRTEYFITMDAHSRTTDACVKTRLGKLVQRVRLKTTIPVLAEFIESVPHLWQQFLCRAQRHLHPRRDRG